MATKKNKPASKVIPWRKFEDNFVKEIIDNLVHFSSKMVNSNAHPTGMRISNKRLVDPNYICVQSVGPEKVPLDYLKNVGSTATVVKQLEAVLANTVSELFTDVPAGQELLYQRIYQNINKELTVGANYVSKRLRQIILQTQRGVDVAVTPMSCAGLGALINIRIEEEIKKQDNTAFYRPRAYLEHGGANPQNIGRHARSLNRPLWFTAPCEDKDLRRAYSIHFNGPRLKISESLLKNYHGWREQQKHAFGGVLRSTAETRSFERKWVGDVVSELSTYIEQSRSLLLKNQDILPTKTLLDKDVDTDLREWVDTALRSSNWRVLVSKRIYTLLLHSEYHYSGNKQTLGLGEDDAERWLKTIEECLT